MGLITWAKGKVSNRIARLVEAEAKRIIDNKLGYMIPQLVEFQLSPKEDRQSYYDHSKDPLGNLGYFNALKEKLITLDISVKEVDIDISDFESWLDNFSEIRNHYQTWDEVFIEKCLEHYLAFRNLSTSQDDVYIDIAAAGSPWADILNKKGIKAYRLDLCYPEGIRGIEIGADAGDTKLPDGFADVLSAHCAYECFMGDADVRFVKEAARVLNDKGRYAIIPLYLDDNYYISTSPYCDQKYVVIDSQAKKVWRDDGNTVSFSRHYSPESFLKRVFSSIPAGMTGNVLYFRNIPKVMEHYQGQRVYCFFMFYCAKSA